MLIKAMIGLLAAAGLIIFFWLLRGCMLMPVRLGKNQRLDLVLTISGEGPPLEHTVAALRWLIENGTLPAQLVLRDAGMDEETRSAAELLSRRGEIKLIH